MKVKSSVTIGVILTMVWSPFIIGTSWAQSTDDSQHQEMPEEQPARIDLDLHGDIMLVSATIVGFGGFGGLLAARFRGNDIKKQVVCILIIYGALFTKIALHLFVILSVSQRVLSQSTYEAIMIATTCLIGIIVICFGINAILHKNYAEMDLSIKHTSASQINKVAAEIKRSPV